MGLLLGLVPAVYSQNNYWTQQYSAYAGLTGGACLSCYNDNSIFYYNPGAIGFVDSNSFNISANLYAIDFVKLKNGAGRNIDLNSTKLSVNANVMAGNITFRRFPRLHIIYGYILRNYSKLDFEQNNIMNYNVIGAAPGQEFYRATFDLSHQFTEYWGGIAAGYRISDHVSVGLGHYGGYSNIKNQFFQESITDAIAPDSSAYTARTAARFKYNLNHFYILFKPGINLRFGKLRASLTAMLPSISVWSSGRVYESLELENLNLYQTDTTSLISQFPSLTVIGDQKNLKTKFKLAPSIATGIDYGDDDFRIALHAEYFFGLKQYDMIRGDEAVYASPNQLYGNNPIPDFLKVKTGSYPVLNVGIGLDKRVSEKISILAGFRTDFNNKVPLFRKDYTDYINASTPTFWNYLHYSFGITLLKPNSKTFLGLTYKQGFSNYSTNFVNLSEPNLENYLVGPNNNDMKVSIHAIGFVIGYTNFMGKGKPFGLSAPKKKAKKTKAE